jgi:hypothetical protein
VATYTLNTVGKVTSESVQNVDLSNNDAVTQVSSASLTYYTTNQSGGNAGDLELMQTFDQSGVETSATYYRYYGENGVRTIFLLTRGDSPARIGAC